MHHAGKLLSGTSQASTTSGTVPEALRDMGHCSQLFPVTSTISDSDIYQFSQVFMGSYSNEYREGKKSVEQHFPRLFD